jgi:hypothetical protein
MSESDGRKLRPAEPGRQMLSAVSAAPSPRTGSKLIRARPNRNVSSRASSRSFIRASRAAHSRWMSGRSRPLRVMRPSPAPGASRRRLSNALSCLVPPHIAETEPLVPTDAVKEPVDASAEALRPWGRHLDELPFDVVHQVVALLGESQFTAP